MISLELASMVGGGPGRCQDSVRAPVKKVAKRMQVVRRRLDWGIRERIEKAKRGRAASRMEKAKRWEVRIPAATPRVGGITGFLKLVGAS
jgi:hypothetical protein